jgi:hypothetical protein
MCQFYLNLIFLLGEGIENAAGVEEVGTFTSMYMNTYGCVFVEIEGIVDNDM